MMSMMPDHTPSAASGAERRREKRYEVQLSGEMGVDGEIFPVSIGDLSGSGALIMMAEPPDQGAIADLWISGFGDVEIKIMFSGDGMCGVMFTRPAEHRDRLLKWLTGELSEGKGAA
jgi:hypothetical protein